MANIGPPYQAAASFAVRCMCNLSLKKVRLVIRVRLLSKCSFYTRLYGYVDIWPQLQKKSFTHACLDLFPGESCLGVCGGLKSKLRLAQLSSPISTITFQFQKPFISKIIPCDRLLDIVVTKPSENAQVVFALTFQKTADRLGRLIQIFFQHLGETQHSAMSPWA